MKELQVLIEGRPAGILTEDRHGALAFRYDAGYREDDTSTPLSLSMPLSAGGGSGERLLAFLWGLLPDNQAVLDRWGATYRVSATSPFALLANVGEECAGAVQFFTPVRMGGAGGGGATVVSEEQLGERLRLLRRDPAAWQLAGYGQFSLAGAQSKFAVLRNEGRWWDPRGMEPTNVIIKPAVGGLADQELNEHLCLALARSAGLTAARSQVRDFDGERAVCVDRYDRFRQGRAIRRIHQEDLCQAMAVRPARKYQSDGGPGILDIVGVLRRSIGPAAPAEFAVAAFLDAVIFNWLVAGTDAHAKNYSVLLAGAEVALAPLYDITSVLPYVSREPWADPATQWQPSEVRLAMSVAGEDRVAKLELRHWLELAEVVNVSADGLVARIDALASGLHDQLRLLVNAPEVTALGSDLPARFLVELERHLGLCRTAMLGRPGTRRRRVPNL